MSVEDKLTQEIQNRKHSNEKKMLTFIFSFVSTENSWRNNFNLYYIFI